MGFSLYINTTIFSLVLYSQRYISLAKSHIWLLLQCDFFSDSRNCPNISCLTLIRFNHDKLWGHSRITSTQKFERPRNQNSVWWIVFSSPSVQPITVPRAGQQRGEVRQNPLEVYCVCNLWYWVAKPWIKDIHERDKGKYISQRTNFINNK